MAYAQKLYKGRGIVYIDKNDVGNCSAIQLAISTTNTTVKNYRKTNGGDIYNKDTIESIELTITALDWTNENLLKLLQATKSTVTTTTLTNQTYVVTTNDVNKLIAFDNISTITAIEKDAVAAVENVDYEVRKAGFIPLSTGTYTVDLTVEDSINFEAFNTTFDEVPIIIAIENEFDENELRVFKFHKVSISPIASIDLLAEDLSNLEIKAKVIADTTKATGLSQYFTMQVKK